MSSPPFRRPRRHEAVLKQLSAGLSPCVLPGDHIATEGLFLRGHGTYVDEKDEDEGPKLRASVRGVTSKVNKLITVRPLRSRYFPMVGDVVVGRVSSVAQTRWLLDVNAHTEALLQLSAIRISKHAVQRRTMLGDELEMRAHFVEGDLLSAEVHSQYNDGSIVLHSRSLRYGKLQGGVFVCVCPQLVRRSKSHFLDLERGVSMIVGVNGYIFVSATKANDDNVAVRTEIVRVCQCVRALDMLNVSIFDKTIMETVRASLMHRVSTLTTPTIAEKITIVARRLIQRLQSK